NRSTSPMARIYARQPTCLLADRKVLSVLPRLQCYLFPRRFIDGIAHRFMPVDDLDRRISGSVLNLKLAILVRPCVVRMVEYNGAGAHPFVDIASYFEDIFFAGFCVAAGLGLDYKLTLLSRKQHILPHIEDGAAAPAGVVIDRCTIDDF